MAVTKVGGANMIAHAQWPQCPPFPRVAVFYVTPAQSVTCVFFFGDGGGGANAYFQRNLKNLWLLFIYFYLFFFFFGGGGVSGPPIPLWIRTSVRNK